MKKAILLYLLMLIVPAIVAAQTIVHGTVTNARTKQPIVGALVRTTTSGEAAQTTTDGRYELRVSVGATHLIFSHIGFIADTIVVNSAQGGNYSVQLQPLQHVLAEVNVQGYQTNRPLLETAGALSVIGGDVLQQTDESSLVRAVNTVPGVKMDERAPGSYRISVRGSTLRSPYG
ncbi:MAG TPA: carboxypeptidase-like regulatory domain-containing protein, partial [Pontibacter sp.]